jgi:hypothetical protein
VWNMSVGVEDGGGMHCVQKLEVDIGLCIHLRSLCKATNIGGSS